MVGRGTKTISATPRQLESLIRLSEGLAKMRHARYYWGRVKGVLWTMMEIYRKQSKAEQCFASDQLKGKRSNCKERESAPLFLCVNRGLAVIIDALSQ